MNSLEPLEARLASARKVYGSAPWTLSPELYALGKLSAIVEARARRAALRRLFRAALVIAPLALLHYLLP